MFFLRYYFHEAEAFTLLPDVFLALWWKKQILSNKFKRRDDNCLNDKDERHGMDDCKNWCYCRIFSSCHHNHDWGHNECHGSKYNNEEEWSKLFSRSKVRDPQWRREGNESVDYKKSDKTSSKYNDQLASSISHKYVLNLRRRRLEDLILHCHHLKHDFENLNYPLTANRYQFLALFLALFKILLKGI